ncbi:MAG: GNAT family N-acetyltransferase [Oscillospiraceae bacterium]|nr:GNAT family N-acetyltransferase [Oscillospiraceae bacterium]
MLDRTIPFFNTILRCDRYESQPVMLPEGFSIVPYQDGYEKAWAELEYAIGDFDSLKEAEDYFTATYLLRDELRESILFAVDPQGKVVGTCIAWQDPREDSLISSLHWLVVDEHYHNMGLGKALCHSVMNLYTKQDQLPVYIHTQPWSWKAILLYLSLGFRLQKKDSFSRYVNEYEQAMQTLKDVLTQEQYTLLCRLSED